MNLSKNNPIEIAQEVLRAEADSIYGLMDQLDDNFSKAIDLIMRQPGRVLVLGVGKSEHIVKWIAAKKIRVVIFIAGLDLLSVSHRGPSQDILLRQTGSIFFFYKANPRGSLSKASSKSFWMPTSIQP